MAAASYFRHELYTPGQSPRLDLVRHAGSAGTGPAPGYSSWSAGENLAWGAPSLSASGTVSRWMASSGHRANILNPRWRNIGVGAVQVRDPRGYYGSLGRRDHRGRRVRRPASSSAFLGRPAR